MVKIIIDASQGIFGRLCGFAAKKALEGDEVIIVNSEKAIITGNKKDIIQKYKVLRAKGGTSLKGPKYSRYPYLMLKRGIRGMLPDHRKGQGKKAFARIKCYNNVPKEFEGQKMIKAGHAKPKKYIELKELSERL
jgi:ribosomal protein uL13|tara:strand:+ start:948 stop:1352 length:405 start_codon:yes stop_codon:yes gene_type:complete